MPNISVEESNSLRKKHFGFLVDEYGFELKKTVTSIMIL
jgi:hypothetical protein